MLDIRLIREDTNNLKKGLQKKKVDTAVIDKLLALDRERRDLITEGEKLKAERNQANDKISKAKKEGTFSESLLLDLKVLSQKIGEYDSKVGKIDENINKMIVAIPNFAHESVPDGSTAEQNKTVKEWGKPKEFSFKPKDHMELAAQNGWISFERATKISGAGFALYQKEGARLIRALMNFMVDLHVKKHGYQEIWPPSLVNRTSMTGTGQLPKMEEDMYALKNDDFFLIPTAEVPVTNILRDEVLKEEELPVKFVAYSHCFRREAGSYGKDTR